MNALRTLWCRTYQACFRAAIPLLPYREPKPLRNFAQAADVLERKGIKRVLVVTDATLMELGLITPLLSALEAHRIRASVYKDVVPNPTVANVEAARARYLADGCGAIIAFGGGSAMDCAKAAGARVARPHKPVRRMRGVLKVLAPLPLLIAVPTTAGTGSETTLAAVITDDETHYKYPINDFALIPRYAVLDYRTTLGLPPHITATTGMDALVHAVEAYIGRSTTRDTRANAIEAVREIHQYLLRAYRNGTDAEAREHMLHAAYCAGLAFTKSYVGYVHAVAHSLGGQYGIAHGLANAALLPYFLDEYGESCEKRLADLARKAGVVPAAMNDRDAATAFIEWVRDMNAAMDIPTTLPGIRNEDIPLMARHADAEGNPLYPVPRLMDSSELERMYHLVQEPTEEPANGAHAPEAAATAMPASVAMPKGAPGALPAEADALAKPVAHPQEQNQVARAPHVRDSKVTARPAHEANPRRTHAHR